MIASPLPDEATIRPRLSVQLLHTSFVHLHHLSPPNDGLTLLSLPTEPPQAAAHPHTHPALVGHRTPSVLDMALIGSFLSSSSWPAPCCAHGGRSPPLILQADFTSTSMVNEGGDPTYSPPSSSLSSPSSSFSSSSSSLSSCRRLPNPVQNKQVFLPAQASE